MEAERDVNYCHNPECRLGVKVVRTSKNNRGAHGDITKRWYKCEMCGAGHTTYEITKYEYDLLKRNGGGVHKFIAKLKEYLDGENYDT